MDIIVTLIVGGIVGWLASLVMKTDAQMGIVSNIIIGIVGALVGSWLAGVLGISTAGSIMSWVLAVAGAAILIVVLKALRILK